MRRSMFSLAASRLGVEDEVAVEEELVVVDGGLLEESSWTDGSPLTRREGRRAESMVTVGASSVMVGSLRSTLAVVGGGAEVMKAASSLRTAGRYFRTLSR